MDKLSIHTGRGKELSSVVTGTGSVVNRIRVRLDGGWPQRMRPGQTNWITSVRPKVNARLVVVAYRGGSLDLKASPCNLSRELRICLRLQRKYRNRQRQAGHLVKCSGGGGTMECRLPATRHRDMDDYQQVNDGSGLRAEMASAEVMSIFFLTSSFCARP